MELTDESTGTGDGMSNGSSKTYAYTDTEVGHILDRLEGDDSFLDIPSIPNLKRNFEFITKRLCTLQLHSVTLAKYHKCGRIPRGMRSQLRPNMFYTDEEFKIKFEQISNKYAMDLIILNIEFPQRETAQMKIKVNDAETLLKSNLPDDDYSSFVSKQQDFLLKFKSDLEENKRKKWHRDIVDYQNGKVYNWASRPQPAIHRWDRVPYKRNQDIDATVDSPVTQSFLGLRPDRKEVVNLRGEEGENGGGAIRTRMQRLKTQTPKQQPKKK